MTNNHLISIVIVNWNSGDQLRRCVDSICNSNHEVQYEIIVVDNDSNDGSEIFIDKDHKATLVHARCNLGFGKACNLGSSYATGDYLLFLNPDAAIFSDTLKTSLGFMSEPSNMTVGICGVRLVDEEGDVARGCTRFPAPTDFILHSIGIAHIFPRLNYFMVEWAHDSTRDVDHVIGAFFLVRRTVFDVLGGFDERFFVYLEDLDFSYRARHAGWRSVYLTDAQAFHAGGGVSDQVKAHRLFYSIRSRVLYAFKHFSKVDAVLVAIVSFIFEPMFRSVLALLRGSWPTLNETFRGYAMLLRWLPQWVFKGVTR
jgi:GT2 family glycosyltransferase